MAFTIDRKIYSDSVITKAVYWLSNDYAIKRISISPEIEEIEFIGLDKEATENAISRLMPLLNDYKLREIISNETKEIKTILYAKAFAEDENLKEEDIHE